MLNGDWVKFQSVIDKIGDGFKSEMSQQVMKGLKLIEARVLSHIDKQDLEWDELSEKYAKRKENEGLDPDILRATNRMYSNITTKRMNSFQGMTGVRRGVMTDDGDDIVDVALIHEQPDNDGTIMPARKLWEPTFKEVEKELPGNIIKSVVNMVKK